MKTTYKHYSVPAASRALHNLMSSLCFPALHDDIYDEKGNEPKQCSLNETEDLRNRRKKPGLK